jgi:hypothetical protein
MVQWQVSEASKGSCVVVCLGEPIFTITKKRGESPKWHGCISFYQQRKHAAPGSKLLISVSWQQQIQETSSQNFLYTDNLVDKY